MNLPVQLHRRLVEEAYDLAAELPDHPTGSVLRCYARAVRRARLAGVPEDELPGRARAIARGLLECRVSRTGLVPQQRGLSRASLVT